MVSMGEIDNGVLEDSSLAEVSLQRAHVGPSESDSARSRVSAEAERAGLAAAPVAAATARFVGQDAGLVSQGTPAPRLVRAALRMVEAVKAAARSSADATLSDAGSDLGAALREGGTAASRAAPRTTGRAGDMIVSAAEAGREAGRRLVRSAIEGVRRERDNLGRYTKFVTDDAMVHTMGNARPASPVFSMAGRMAAVGLISGMAIVIPDSDAKAWGRNGNRGNGIAIAAGIGAAIVGGVVLDRVTGGGISRTLGIGQGGYGGGYGGSYGNGYGSYNPGYRPTGQIGYGGYGAPAQQYLPRQAYDGYGGGYGAGYGGGYAGHRAAAPSNDFIKGAKVLVANQIGNIHGADRIIDSALANGMDCVRRMGPGANCTIRTNGVAMDFGRGEFIATYQGTPVVVETNGYANVTRPDILRQAFVQALRIKEAETYGGGRFGY